MVKKVFRYKVFINTTIIVACGEIVKKFFNNTFLIDKEKEF